MGGGGRADGRPCRSRRIAWPISARCPGSRSSSPPITARGAIDYDEVAGGFPRVVRVRRATGASTDITARVSQLETNVTIDPEAFTIEVPAGDRSDDARRTPFGRAAGAQDPMTLHHHPGLCQDQPRPADPRHRAPTGITISGRSSRPWRSAIVSRSRRRRGPFAITCDDPLVPTDRANLVWKAASLLQRAGAGRARRAARHRHPLAQAHSRARPGWAAAAPMPRSRCWRLNRLWKLELDLAVAQPHRRRGLGADVPFFLAGGTALGLGPRRRYLSARGTPDGARGDPAAGFRRVHRRGVPLVRRASPADPAGRRQPAPTPPGWPAWASSLRNDLEPPVIQAPPDDRPDPADRCWRPGRSWPPCPGSGSAVFGLFEAADAARRTAAGPGPAGLDGGGHPHAESARISRRPVWRPAPLGRSRAAWNPDLRVARSP